MLLACHPQDRRADGPGALRVLDVAAAQYSPRQGERAIPAEEATCKAWRLDKDQAETFFRLSKPLQEGELHDYDWLPCSIKGHLIADGGPWEFEINAAGTSTWRGKDQARLLGCGQPACAPLVIMTKGDDGN